MKENEMVATLRLMESASYLRFAQAIQAGEYAQAEALAERMRDVKEAEWAFWTTQLGYASFLDEGNDIVRYELAPACFSSLVARFPEDTNGLFWKAYVEYMLLAERDLAYEELRSLRLHNPSHPYAALVMAGLADSPREKIHLLKAAIDVIPNNARALWDLVGVLESVGWWEEARRTRDMLAKGTPFVETRFGIMNEYINEVFTGATLPPGVAMAHSS